MSISQGEGSPRSPQELALPTDRGLIRCLYHKGAPGAGAVLMVGGTDGGFDGPADAIYPTLAEDLAAAGIGTLRVDFRLHQAPGPLDQGVFDVLAGLAFLRQERVGPVALVGHSYGGAVVIAAGTRSPEVVTVVALSTQTAGAQGAALLAPRPLLLVHGSQDRRLPPQCSRLVYSWAREPKELVILEGAKHSLRQRREELRRLLVAWLVDHLSAARADWRLGEGST